MMKTTRISVLGMVGFGLLLVGAGCSGMTASQAGQAIGSIVGSAIVPGIGTTVGALAGTLAGLVVDEQVDKAREKKERVDLNQQLQGTSAPQASPQSPVGQPTRVWVDETMRDGRVLAGRFEVRPVP